MKSKLLLPLQFLFIIWAIFLLDMFLINISFCKYGILPRNVNGLIGIITSTFLHANLAHIISNSILLVFLLYISIVFFNKETKSAIILIIFISGSLVWLFGRQGYHVGASSLIYGLTGFLTFFGIFKKSIVPIVIGIFVGLTYGTTMIMGLLPIFQSVSWEGHLFGGIAGVISAKMLSK